MWVLLEHFVVHHPHTWGALVTFIELLRNPKYEFWNKEFICVVPEVTILLGSVSLTVLSGMFSLAVSFAN